MRIVLMGPPGAGKGTQGELIAQKLDIPKISTGDILRQEIAKGSEVGKQVDQLMSEGKFASDETIIDIVKQRVSLPEYAKGYICDGFPRTLEQAKMLDKEGVVVDYVIFIDVPDEVLVKRISGRRVHVPSGRVYHIEHKPPRQEGLDDITGEALKHREDDKEEVIRERLNAYHAQTAPVVDYYMNNNDNAKFVKVDGTGAIGSMTNTILHDLK